MGLLTLLGWLLVLLIPLYRKFVAMDVPWMSPGGVGEREDAILGAPREHEVRVMGLG